MDEWTLNDLLECSVCLERLDTSSKVLPCQHTFCKKCLEEIVESHKELRCPECRVLIEVGIEELPPNVLLMRILEGMKNAPKKRTGGSGRVTNHGHSASSIGAHHGAAHLTVQHHQHHHSSSPAHVPTQRSNHEHNTQHTSPKQAILPGQPCARALYSYTSPEPGDLTFKKGDLILLKKKVDANWYHGDCSGHRGVFPSVYVEVLTPLPSPVPQCKALYDFRMTTDEEEGCLTFSKGEVISVIRRVDENWAEGKLADRIGIFPLAFVELNQVARALMKLSTNSQPGPSRVAPPTPTSEETTPLIPTVENQQAATASVASTTNQQQLQQQVNAVASTNMQAPAAVAPHVLHRLAGSAGTSSSQSPSSSTTPNSSSTSCSSPSSTAPSSPASPPPQAPQQGGEHPPPPHPRGTSSTTPLVQNQASHHREKRHSLNLLHAANPTTVHRLSGEILESSIQLSEQQAQSLQPGSGRSHRHRRSVSDQPASLGPSVAASAYALASSSSSTTLPATYVAMYPYKPQKTDELELKKGALYTVTEKCQDGWFKGMAQGSHKSGVFPGNYVALAKTQAHSPSSASGGSRGGGGGGTGSGARNGASASPSSWSRPFTPSATGSTGGQQAGRQNKGAGASSERPYMDIARTMLAAAHAAMHNVTVSQTSPTPGNPKTSSAGLAGQHLTTPPELPPRAASPNTSASTVASPASISSSWHAQPIASSQVVHSEGTSAQIAPLGRSQSHSMVGLSTSVAPPPNVTVMAPTSQARPSSDKQVKEKKSGSGLIRRLTTMKKCKSPPPNTYSMDNPVFEDGTCGIVASGAAASCLSPSLQPAHARSGSCPSQLLQQLPCSEPPATPSEFTPSSSRHLHHRSATAAAGGLFSSGSQRIKHKERANIITANPAALLGSSSRPSPLGAAASSVEASSIPLSSNHRKSSSLDASSGDLGKKPRQIFPAVKERFRCIVPYPPNSEYELALQVGDVIHVHKKRDDGWYKGTQERTGRTGLFPASFVEAL